MEGLAGLTQIDMLPSDDAHRRYAELRPARLAISPTGFLAFLHYDDAFATLCNQQLRPMALEGLDFAGVTDGPLRRFFEHILFTQEGADHQRLRRLVASAFSPRTVDRLRRSVREQTVELLGPVIERGSGDLVEELCKPLAITTLCDLLGVPRKDISSFQHWAGGMGLAFGPLTPEARIVVEDSLQGISDYAGTLIDRRRSEPGDDLISQLIRAEEQGERLNNEELTATVSNMLFAGYDTTYRQISLALLSLARNRDAWARLATDPTMAGPCAEEVLRMEPIAHSTVRLALADTEVNGVPLAAGARVEPMIAAANRDPSVFADPDAFAPGREGPRPLSFGQGIHTCLGAALARLEVAEAMEAVATRLQEWNVAVDPNEIEWYPLSEPFRGVAHLSVSRT
jgi:cytochrome P450